MAVETEADLKQKAAIEHVETAVRLLSEIVVDECPGTNDYKEAHRHKLKRHFNTLVDVRDDLKS